MKIINIIKELYKNVKSSFITALICTITNVLGQYLNYNFDFIQIDNFKISFDCLLFIVLIFGISGWVMTAYYIILKVIAWNKKFLILQTLKKCNKEEKNFFYYLIYNNDNTRIISTYDDEYFYKSSAGMHLYRKNFNTQERVMKFLRGLENKGILRQYDFYSMIVEEVVWKILIKNADEIFKDMSHDE